MFPKQKIRKYSREINKKQFKRIDSLYNRYAATLYGYVLSVVKDKEQTQTIFVKIFTALNGKPQNPEEECRLIKYIQIANKKILAITKKERRSFLSIISKDKKDKRI